MQLEGRRKSTNVEDRRRGGAAAAGGIGLGGLIIVGLIMLLTGQEILFLDEPTYGQDLENKRELMADMLDLKSKGVTIVFIKHDEDLIREYARRVVYIEDGRVALDGTPDDYFRRCRDA